MRQQVIWKFPLELTADPQTFEIPIPARVVHFERQDGQLCIWVLVEKDASLSSETYQIFGTGRTTPPADEAMYIGTTQAGPYVWHLFKLMS